VVEGNLVFTASGNNHYRLNFTGTAPQTIEGNGNITLPAPMHSVNFDNSSGVTLMRDLTANCPVNVNGKLIFNGNYLNGSCDFNVSPGAEICIDSPEGIIISGFTSNLRNSGARTFSPDAGYSYNGTGPQVTGDALPSFIRRLTVSNSAGVVLTSSVLVNENVNLLAGNISTGENVLSIAASGNVLRTGGYVIGNLSKYVAAGSRRIAVFEVGTQNGYTPVTATFENISSPGSLTVKSVQSTYPGILPPQDGLRRYWTLTNNGIIFERYSIVFNYLSLDFTETFPEEFEGSMIAVNMSPGNSRKCRFPEISSRNTAENYLQLTGLNSFGDFTFIKYEPQSQKLNIENLTMKSSGTEQNSNFTESIPVSFGISQNYPNPFNPSTRIDYQVPADSKVSVKLYDLIGHEVRSFVEEFKPAGKYTITFNSGSLASGIYIYRMTAESVSPDHDTPARFEKTLKMTLIK
jgi:hypothetical protein